MNDDQFIYYAKNKHLFIKYEFNTHKKKPIVADIVNNLSLTDGYLFALKKTVSLLLCFLILMIIIY